MKDSKSPRDKIARYLNEVPRSGIRDFFDIVASRPDIISLSIGEPDFVAPWHIREASIYALERGATSYTSNLGTPKLRKAISAYVERIFDVTYSPDNEILVTVGVSEALDLAIRATVNPGDEVLYHEPCYVSYGPVVQFAHGVPVAVPTTGENEFRLTREMLEEYVTDRSRVLLLNFPTNPTGATLTRDDLEGIAAFAVEHDLVVISDEIYAELTYEGEHISIASLPGMKERTIFLHGFSKGWAMTGYRAGYACAPPELTEAMMKIHQYTMLCAPILSQEAAYEALTQPDQDVAPMKQAYKQRRNYIHSALSDIGIPCHKPRGAFYVFPNISQYGLSSKDFALKFIDEKDVACVPGTAFGDSGEGYLRCSYATDIEQIKTAMARLKEFVASL